MCYVLILAVNAWSNGKFSCALTKMLNYCHEIQQRYYDAKQGDNRWFACDCFNLQK